MHAALAAVTALKMERESDVFGGGAHVLRAVALTTLLTSALDAGGGMTSAPPSKYR